MTEVSPQALLDSGQRIPCPRCSGLIRPAHTRCPFCNSPRSGHRVETTPRRALPRGGPARGALGSLEDLSGQELVLVVPGHPASQGSMKAVAKGVLKRDNGAALEAWRQRISNHARECCGPAWRPANAAVTVSAVFTVPRPKSAPAARSVHADGYRDLDKLERAVGDALCPSSATAFRVLASDMRIVTWDAHKTHPRPLHDHPDALLEPGVVIRVRLASPWSGLDAPLPQSTVSTGGQRL